MTYIFLAYEDDTPHDYAGMIAYSETSSMQGDLPIQAPELNASILSNLQRLAPPVLTGQVMSTSWKSSKLSYTLFPTL